MNKPKKPGDYIKLMVEAYAELRAQQAGQITHRVVEYNKNENGQYQITVQITGKSLIFKTSPQEIMADDGLLESFSRKDIRLLTYLACEDIKEPKHEVLSQKFIRNMNQFFFKLKHGKTGEEMEKSAKEISADPALIKALSPEDAHKIGYVTANEQIKEEKKRQDDQS
jgi:hypothetical protein